VPGMSQTIGDECDNEDAVVSNFPVNCLTWQESSDINLHDTVVKLCITVVRRGICEWINRRRCVEDECTGEW